MVLKRVRGPSAELCYLDTWKGMQKYSSRDPGEAVIAVVVVPQGGPLSVGVSVETGQQQALAPASQTVRYWGSVVAFWRSQSLETRWSDRAGLGASLEARWPYQLWTTRGSLVPAKEGLAPPAQGRQSPDIARRGSHLIRSRMHWCRTSQSFAIVEFRQQGRVWHSCLCARPLFSQVRLLVIVLPGSQI